MRVNRSPTDWPDQLPRKKPPLSGGDISAPVFSAVVGGALRMLGVAPDAPGTATDPLTGVTTVVKR